MPMMSPTLRHACTSCRQKKLRCDRKSPCANCVARSVDCRQQALPGARRPANSSGPSTIETILQRLDHLEALVVKDHVPGHGSGNIQSQTPNTLVSAISPPKKDQPEKDRDRDRDTDRDTDKDRDRDRDRDIEGDADRDTDRDDITFRISGKDGILHSFLSHDLAISVAYDAHFLDETDRSVVLPPQWLTLKCFQIYFEHIGPFQCIVYEPRCLGMVEDVYNQVTQVSSTTAPRGLALVLSVIAFGVLLDGEALPLLQQRLHASATYIRSCLNCLEQHRRRMNHTLETVQAMVVLQFLVNHIESFSSRYRILLAEAVSVSQILGFNSVDSAGSRKDLSGPETVDQEIKRRIWWYLAATDWAVSTMQGPLHPTYIVQPDVLSCHYPRNIDLVDLEHTTAAAIGRPLSEPTIMSYCIHRLKVAEISRGFSDKLPRKITDTTCGTVLSLDSQLQSFVQSLPFFFRLEMTSSADVHAVQTLHPYVSVQRIMINMIVNMARCKLHFPYLAGDWNKPLHAFSRQAGVEAAMAVLSLHRGMMEDNQGRVPDFMRLHGTSFHLFVGALVVTADLCFNPSPAEERGDRQLSELLMALRDLETMKQTSQPAEKFVETLKHLLVTYKVWSPSSSAPLTTSDNTVAANEMSEFSLDDFDMSECPVDVQFDNLWDACIEQPFYPHGYV